MLPPHNQLIPRKTQAGPEEWPLGELCLVHLSPARNMWTDFALSQETRNKEVGPQLPLLMAQERKGTCPQGTWKGTGRARNMAKASLPPMKIVTTFFDFSACFAPNAVLSTLPGLFNSGTPTPMLS